MYEPREAHEDAVPLPAFRRITTLHEYDSVGEDFEKREHQRFGADGFEAMVERIAAIERKLGIDDVARFTPR
jgi:hypothetical protein